MDPIAFPDHSHEQLKQVTDRFPVTATLLNNRIMVWDIEESCLLYDLGFYGKPLGVKKAKPGSIYKPIELSVFETAYLLKYQIIRLFEPNGRELNFKEFLSFASANHEHFRGKFLVYSVLRDAGFIVRPGLKFGEAFSVYRRGPGIDHAPYLVHIASYDSQIDPIELVRAGRLSHSVNKMYVIAVLQNEETVVKFFGFKRFKP